MNCKNFQTVLPDLMIDQRSISAAARAHLETCVPCKEDYTSLISTFLLLDTWQAPAPSPYFDQRLAVRLREAAAAPPQGWWEGLRSRLLFNTGAQFRPLLAGAMAAVLLVGGGAFAGLSAVPAPQASAQVSATVGDLQILDKNDQALQQMDQLVDDQSPDDTSVPAPRS